MAYLTVEGEVVDLTADFDNPYSPVDTVLDRFSDSTAKANEMYTLLVGEEGSGGLLKDIKDSLASAPTISITAPSVNDSITLDTTGLSVPTFDPGTLTDLPENTAIKPTLDDLPSVDTDFSDIIEPEDIASLTLNWSESVLPTDVYDAILTRMLSDLQSGATGLDPDVEQAIHDRAKARLLIDRIAEWDRINNTASEMQFAYPSGVLLSAYTDYGMSANRQDTDIENQIIVSQGDLAQKNSQFMMQQAVALEGLIRQTREGESNRNLDAAKALLNAIVEEYKARLQKFISIWEGRAKKIQAQSEILKGAIERQKGLIEIYASEISAYEKETSAISARNKNITDVYVSEVQGFGEAERAIAMKNDSSIKLLEQQIKNASMELTAAIAESEQTVAAYSAHETIQERISTALAQLTSGVVASTMTAVHASASLGYSGSESSSKSFSMGGSVNESHSFEHDPEA